MLSGPVLVRSWLGIGFSIGRKEFLVLGLVNILRKLKIIGLNFAKFSISKKKGKKKRKKRKKTSLVPCGWIPWTLFFEPNPDPTKNRNPASTAGLADLGP